MDKQKWIRAGLKISEHLKEIEKICEQMNIGYVGLAAYGDPEGISASAIHIDDDTGIKRELHIVGGKARLSEDGREFYIQT